jgi:hypothetical protein
MTSRQRQTNSTDETKYVVTCGKGIPAPMIVSYISLCWLATKSLFPPEIAKNTPSEIRARRTANSSREWLPDKMKRISASDHHFLLGGTGCRHLHPEGTPQRRRQRGVGDDVVQLVRHREMQGISQDRAHNSRCTTISWSYQLS